MAALITPCMKNPNNGMTTWSCRTAQSCSRHAVSKAAPYSNPLLATVSFDLGGGSVEWQLSMLCIPSSKKRTHPACCDAFQFG